VDLRLLGRLLGFLRPHGALAAAALGALALGTACELAAPWIVKIVVDRHLAPRAFAGAWRWVVLYVAALAGASGFLALQMLCVSVLGQRVILDLRRRTFARLQRLPVAFFDRTPAGRLVTRLTSDVEALQELISSGLVSAAADAVVLAAIAGLLLALNARLALVTFAVLPPMAVFVEILKRRIRESNREARRRLAALNAFLQEQAGGAAVIKAFAREEGSVRGFGERNAAYAAENVRLTTCYSLYFPGVELFASTAAVLVLWRGGGGVMEGTMTLGTLVAFLEYARRFFDPLKDLSDKYGILQSALASCERIFRILDTPESPEYGEAPQGPPAVDEPATAAPASALAAAEAEAGCSPEGDREERGEAVRRRRRAAPFAVEFRDVWFAYPPGAREGKSGRGPALRGVSFVLHEGQTGALVGATGSGKTTVLSLLCRFYEPDRGRILLFGRDIRAMPAAELRAMMALVLQDPFLFSGTIAENVGATGEALRRVAAWAGLDRVAARRGGFDAPVGERGVLLSAGERQLVALARALARGPRLLLLDEATSNVDPAADAHVRRALAAHEGGRTSLVVAHRLETVLSADTIVVLHRGAVREQGTHQELLAAEGIYRRLYDLQFAPAP